MTSGGLFFSGNIKTDSPIVGEISLFISLLSTLQGNSAMSELHADVVPYWLCDTIFSFENFDRTWKLVFFILEISVSD